MIKVKERKQALVVKLVCVWEVVYMMTTADTDCEEMGNWLRRCDGNLLETLDRISYWSSAPADREQETQEDRYRTRGRISPSEPLCFISRDLMLTMAHSSLSESVCTHLQPVLFTRAGVVVKHLIIQSIFYPVNVGSMWVWIPAELFQAGPTGWRHQGRPRTEIISHGDWEHLWISQSEV